MDRVCVCVCVIMLFVDIDLHTIGLKFRLFFFVTLASLAEPASFSVFSVFTIMFVSVCVIYGVFTGVYMLLHVCVCVCVLTFSHFRLLISLGSYNANCLPLFSPSNIHYLAYQV